jgi:ribosome recycling factor
MARVSSTTLEQRKEIFKALVEAQDQRLNVRQSRKVVSDQYGISEKLIKQIEDEGIDEEWPPL